MQHSGARASRIPDQQGIGQILPPVPVGLDSANAPSFPPGAMPAGTRVQVGKYQVIIHSFFAEGGFAHVYLARIEGKSGYVVLKRVAVPDQDRLRMVEKEIEFMRGLGDHKNIVRYYESRIDVLPVGGFQALILMEYCPGGGVIDLMNRRLQQRLTEPEILGIFSDVAEALAYMHYCNPPVLHRDLKVENILILNQNHYKLCDFGSASLSKGPYVPSSLAEMQKLEDDIQRHTTLQYRAPEMIDVYQKKPINEKADIWAMGVLLYKLCFYTTPFEEQGQLAILNARFSIPTSPPFSSGLCQLIISMLQEDQNRRPNIYQVMEAISQLRGLECPLRDIYTEETIVSPPSSQTNNYKTPTSPPPPVSKSETNGNGPSIFEKMPTSPAAMPDIKPMRRGRPTKPENTPSSSSTYSNNNSINDNNNNRNNSNNIPSSSSSPPPLPSHSVPLSTDQSPSPSKASPSPPAAPTSTPNDTNHKNTHSTSSTESYDPFDISNFKSKYRRPAPPPKKDEEKTDTFGFQNNFTTADSAPSRVETTPIKLHSTPQPQVATKVKTGNKEEEQKEEEDKENSVKLNKNVSSSIEARFQAIKNAGQQPVKKAKPAPPPKPARFRSSKTVEPSIDEFENKFPSLEELDRNL
ncbi:kinase-like protein [Backusella circina FSU 941]|nr:kinase-like protein [Backusella circina FSU 941]